jgi:hypothetical protein
MKWEYIFMINAMAHPNCLKEQEVLTKALLNMAHLYELKGKELNEIIGLSEASITRLRQGKAQIDPKSKEGEIALLLLRLYRSLNALLGSNSYDKARAWLNSDNQYFGEAPIEHIKSVAGLVHVVNYLDAMRGKI